MLIEDFIYDNYDLIYGLKMISAQKASVIEGNYSLFDTDNPKAHKDTRDELAISLLVKFL